MGAKQTKVPYQPNGRHAMANNPATWSTYAQCMAVVSQFSGVGLTLGNGVFGVDIDKCCDAASGKFTAESREVVIALDSYSEYSPSGTGCHVFGLGNLPGDGKAIVRPMPGCKQVEVKGLGYYYTFTARHLSKTPADLMPRQAQLDDLCARMLAAPRSAATGGLVIGAAGNEEERFRKLMAGDLSDYGGDHSRADLALCSILARRLHNDVFRIDDAFRESPLYRDKWERSDYRSATLLKACKGEPIFDATEEEPVEDDSPRQYLVEALPGPGNEGWFPKGEVSLIGGSSGTGKTSWSIPLLEKVRKGEPVYGHTTQPRDYRVLLNDRSKKGTLATLNALRLPKEAIERCIRLTTKQQQSLPAEILAAVIEQHPGVETLFIEGLDMWLPDLYDMRKVSAVVDGMQRVALLHNVAIVATVGSPKQKSKDGKYSGRDNLFGSVALGRKAETVVLFQFHDAEDVNSVVVCTVLCRCGKPEKFYLAWGDHGLQVTTKPEAATPGRKPEKASVLRLNLRAQFKPGERIRYSPELGVSKGTYYTYLEKAVALGEIDKRDDVFFMPQKT